MAADTVEVVVKLTGLGAVQAGMRQLRASVTAPLEAAVGKVRNLALGLGSTLVAGLSVHRIGAELSQALGDFDKLDAAAQKLGVLTSELSAMEHAAQMADATIEDLHTGLRFLSRAAQANAEAFSALGIQVLDQQGRFRSHQELLEDIADRFADMPDGIAKTALAMELFGGQGANLIPMLNAGSQGLREMNEEARTFGLIIAPELAAASSAVNDNITRLRSAVDGLARTALGELLPALVEISDRLVRWVHENDAVRKGANVLAEALRYLVFDIQALIVATRVWWTTAQTHMAGLAQAFQALGQLLARVWEMPLEMLKALIEHLRIALRAAQDLGQALSLVVQGRFAEARDKAQAAAFDFAESYITASRAIADSALKTGSAMAEAIVAPLLAAKNTVGTLVDEARAGYEELLRTARSLWSPSPLPTPPRTGGSVHDDFEPDQNRRRQLGIELREAEEDLRQRRRAIADELLQLETDFARQEAEKHRPRIEFLRRELALIDEATRALEARLAVERDADAQELFRQGLRRLEGERHGTQSQLTRLERAPDPHSLRDQWVATVTELENRLGTAAEAIARSFANVVGSAIDAIAHGIEGLIHGTLTWGEALRQIGTSILNGVIAAISRMFAEWIAKRALMAMKNMMFSTQEGAVDAAAKAPGAMMSSISSYGVAAVVGMAAMLAALAAISGAFAKGGRPPPGRPALVGEQGPELFIPDQPGTILTARMTERVLAAIQGPTQDFYGVPPTGALISGSMSAPPSGAPGNMSLVLVDDRRQARDFLESAEGQALIIDVVRRRRMDIGLKT